MIFFSTSLVNFFISTFYSKWRLKLRSYLQYKNYFLRLSSLSRHIRILKIATRLQKAEVSSLHLCRWAFILVRMQFSESMGSPVQKECFVCMHSTVGLSYQCMLLSFLKNVTYLVSILSIIFTAKLQSLQTSSLQLSYWHLT